MATIGSMETQKMWENKRENMETYQDLSKNIIQQIYVDPLGCLASDEFMLENVVNNGNNATALCEALGLKNLTVTLEGEEYKMFWMPNPHGLSHYDICFHPEKCVSLNINSRPEPESDNSLKPDAKPRI